jgi:hypothetical protein
MLFVALLLNSIPLGRPVIDHVDVIEINMFYDPEHVDENNDVEVRTQLLFWEVGKDSELHIVDWRWWDNEEVHRDDSGRLKLVFHDKKTGLLRVVYCKTYIATLTAFDPEEVDRKRRGQFRRRKLQTIQEVSR